MGVSRAFQIGWRAVTTALGVVVVWGLLMLVSRLAARTLDGPTVVSYFAAGCIVLAFVWGLHWWRPYFPELFPDGRPPMEV